MGLDSPGLYRHRSAWHEIIVTSVGEGETMGTDRGRTSNY